jgi:CRP/FNR family transcriptional regulator, cyclic AMP receptor protein
MEDLTRILRTHPFLEGLLEPHFGVIVGCAKNVRFAAGDYLFREGEEAGVFYLIRMGQISIDEHVPGRPPLRVETVVPGDILGTTWIFPPHLAHHDARAVEPVVALAFDGVCLRGKMEADPALGYAITKRLLAQTLIRLERMRLARLDVYKP